MHTTVRLLLVWSLATAAAAAGCGDDDDVNPDAAAGTDAPVTAPDGPVATADAATADASLPDGGPVVTTDAGPAAFAFSGPITGPGSPAEGTIVVLWVVSATSPDYAYKFGDGTSAGATYIAGLATDPPPVEALNVLSPGNAFGVGVALLMPPGTSIPEGIYYDGTAFDAAFGASVRHAVIYKTGSLSGVVPWLDAFPAGYACGVCVDNPSGFDSFTPIDCTGVELTTDMAVPGCNWT